MAESSKPPDIPKPTRADLLPLIHAEYQDRMDSLPASVAQGIWDDAERRWIEGHKAEAARNATEAPPERKPDKTERIRIASPEDVANMRTMLDIYAKHQRDQKRLAKIDAEIPDWVDKPDTVHLSLEDEGVAEFSFGPPEDEDAGPPYDNPRPEHPITSQTRKKIEDQGKWGTDWPQPEQEKPEPLSTGVKVPGQTADYTPTEEERREAELLEFMRKPLRDEYDRAGEDRKRVLWAANEEAFDRFKEREAQRFRDEQERTAKVLDLLQRIKEDPSKAHLLPPDGSSMDELHKWHDEMSKPINRPLYEDKANPGAKPAPKASGKPTRSSHPVQKPPKRRRASSDTPLRLTVQTAKAESHWFDWLWDNPLFLGMLVMLAFGISFSPKASTFATWFCLLIAWLLATRLIYTRVQHLAERWFVTLLCSLATAIVFGAFGWWLASPIKASLAQVAQSPDSKTPPATQTPTPLIAMTPRERRESPKPSPTATATPLFQVRSVSSPVPLVAYTPGTAIDGRRIDSPFLGLSQSGYLNVSVSIDRLTDEESRRIILLTVPKTRVIAQNTQTSEEYTATTNDFGDATFFVPYGFYRVRIEAPDGYVESTTLRLLTTAEVKDFFGARMYIYIKKAKS